MFRESDDEVLLVEVKYGENYVCSLEISKSDTVQMLKELAIGEFEMALLQDSNSYRLFKNGITLDDAAVIHDTSINDWDTLQLVNLYKGEDSFSLIPSLENKIGSDNRIINFQEESSDFDECQPVWLRGAFSDFLKAICIKDNAHEI